MTNIFPRVYNRRKIDIVALMFILAYAGMRGHKVMSIRQSVVRYSHRNISSPLHQLLVASIAPLLLLVLLTPSLHATTPTSASPGLPFCWEGSNGTVKTSNGNKLTTVPLFGWTMRGGEHFQFSLYHNSQGPDSAGGGAIGNKWTSSYNSYLSLGGGVANITVQWDNGQSYCGVPRFMYHWQSECFG